MNDTQRYQTAIASLIAVADEASERSVTERVRAENAEARLDAIREVCNRTDLTWWTSGVAIKHEIVAILSEAPETMQP